MKADRIFKTKDEEGKEITLKFQHPNQKALNGAEFAYREMYARCFRKGLLTNAEVSNVVRRRGLWNDELEQEANEIRAKIANLEDKLKEDKGLSDDEGRKICMDISSLRTELMMLRDSVNSISDNTCESVADEHRTRYLCASCTVDPKSGQKVYKDVEDLTSRADEQMAKDAYREATIAALSIMVGRELPTDLSSEYPENQWLEQRKIKDEGEDEDADAKEDEEQASEKPKKSKKRTKKSSSKTSGAAS